MPKETQLASDSVSFSSRKDAEAFLSHSLPLATAGNPKYRGDGGALTQWLTKSVVFGANPNGISVQMSEEVLEFRNGARSATGTHHAQFQIEDVEIAELKDSPDLTEDGEKTRGIIFRCVSGKCIAAKWNGVESPADWTDISIQDETLRAKILAAFQTLKRAVGGRPHKT